MPTPKKYESPAEKQKAYRERMSVARLEELKQKGLPAAPVIPTMPGTARWRALETQALVALETVRDEMLEYYEERSEEWQESERGEEFTARLDAVEEVVSSVENLEE